MGWKFGIITFLIDGLKGIIACLIAWLITGSHFASLLAGLFCVIGHNWPVFFHFRGGKGVACTCAAIFCVQPLWGLLAMIVGMFAVFLTQYLPVGAVLIPVLAAASQWISAKLSMEMSQGASGGTDQIHSDP